MISFFKLNFKCPFIFWLEITRVKNTCIDSRSGVNKSTQESLKNLVAVLHDVTQHVSWK